MKHLLIAILLAMLPAITTALPSSVDTETQLTIKPRDYGISYALVNPTTDTLRLDIRARNGTLESSVNIADGETTTGLTLISPGRKTLEFNYLVDDSVYTQENVEVFNDFNRPLTPELELVIVSMEVVPFSSGDGESSLVNTTSDIFRTTPQYQTNPDLELYLNILNAAFTAHYNSSINSEDFVRHALDDMRNGIPNVLGTGQAEIALEIRALYMSCLYLASRQVLSVRVSELQSTVTDSSETLPVELLATYP